MDNFTREEAAFEAFTRLLKDGRHGRALFDAASVPLPTPLLRLLGEDIIHPRPEAIRKVRVPAPRNPPRPPGWQGNWIWIPIPEAMESTLVKGLLRGATRPLGPKDVVDKLEALGLGNVVSGTIANIGTRLSTAGTIRRDVDGWTLVKTDEAPELHEGFAWGPMEIFEKQEIAAHRRALIVHVLQSYSDGLQIVQLTKALGDCEWFPPSLPRTKDLIKVDLHILQKMDRARRMAGHSGKWTASKIWSE